MATWPRPDVRYRYPAPIEASHTRKGKRYRHRVAGLYVLDRSFPPNFRAVPNNCPACLARWTLYTWSTLCHVTVPGLPVPPKTSKCRKARHSVSSQLSHGEPRRRSNHAMSHDESQHRTRSLDSLTCHHMSHRQLPSHHTTCIAVRLAPDRFGNRCLPDAWLRYPRWPKDSDAGAR
jgi:hypothetical protein